MQLPGPVRRLIDERAEALGFATLQRAAEAMSQAYREGRPPRLSDEERTVAYLVTRMPATYAAAHMAMRELSESTIATVLDAGAGTGAASLAARQWFPHAAVTMLERDAALAGAARMWLPDAQAVAADIARIEILPPHDLVIAAWSLGEMGMPVWKRLWEAARVALVVIEPGTPPGFSLIREVRDNLLAAGARMIAPCPAETACPMAAPNWCHFAARVERSSLHRRIKRADLGYEDEKFSYVAVSRQAAAPARARVIRHPLHRPGLIVIETCVPEGLRTERISKRDREAFRAARHAAWGGRWGTV